MRLESSPFAGNYVEKVRALRQSVSFHRSRRSVLLACLKLKRYPLDES